MEHSECTRSHHFYHFFNEGARPWTAWINIIVVSKIFVSSAYHVYSKVVHIVKLPLTCSEFTMHMLNHWHICRNKGWVFTWHTIFILLCTCYEWKVLRKPTSLKHKQILGAISIIFEQAIHHFSYWIWAVQCNFLTGILGLGLFAFCLRCQKSASKHRGISSILDGVTVWRSWRRCFWILLIGRSFFNKWCSKKLLWKNGSKNITVGVYTATNPSLSSHIPVGLNFLFRNFESKIYKSDNAIWWDTHWTLRHWYRFREDILLDSWKWFVMKKKDIFPTSTQILESVYMPGHPI